MEVFIFLVGAVIGFLGMQWFILWWYNRKQKQARRAFLKSIGRKG